MPVTISYSASGNLSFAGNAASTGLQSPRRLSIPTMSEDTAEPSTFKASLGSIALSMVFNMVFNIVLSNIVLKYILKNHNAHRNIDEDSITLSMTEDEDSIEEDPSIQGNPEALEVAFRH